MRRLYPLLGVLIASLFSVAAGAETFAEWKARWDEERATVLAAYDNRIASEGLKPVYGELQAQVEALPVTSELELQWRRSFVCAMEANLHSGEVALKLDEALGATPEGEPLTPQSLATLQNAAEVDRQFRGDPFRPGRLPMSPDHLLLVNGNRLLDPVCPNHQIAISPASESVAAQQIFRTADILSATFEAQRLPVMEATAATIHDSRERWDAFFKNAMLDQYPWETYANEWGRQWLSALRGTQRQPPTAQLRIGHPTPVVVVDDSNGTSFEPSLAVEGLGWRVYDRKTYEPRWGVSLVAVLKTSSEDSTGYGLLLVARSFSIGAIVRDTPSESDDVQLMLGVDIAKLFNNRSSAAGIRSSELDKTLNGLLGCAVNGFATCGTP